MDFTFSEDQKKLMDEVRQFCVNELSEDFDSDYVGGPIDEQALVSSGSNFARRLRNMVGQQQVYHKNMVAWA